MLGCMESLGKRIEASNKIKKDYEYDFYIKYLSDYENYDINEKTVKATIAEHIIFSNLNNLYSESCSIPASQRSLAEEYADSFAFFVSVGIIKLIDNNYFIDLEKLNKFSKDCNEINNETSYGSAYHIKK